MVLRKSQILLYMMPCLGLLSLEDEGTKFLINVRSCLDQDFTYGTLMETASPLITSITIKSFLFTN